MFLLSHDMKKAPFVARTGSIGIALLGIAAFSLFRAEAAYLPFLAASLMFGLTIFAYGRSERPVCASRSEEPPSYDRPVRQRVQRCLRQGARPKRRHGDLPAAGASRRLDRCEIAKSCPDVALELFAFGRVPLAISARCAHARSKGRTKDNYQFVREDDPDGLTVKTLSGQPFLGLNGVQTVSHSCQALFEEPAEMLSLGISSLRLSPQACDMVAVSSLFRQVADGAIAPMDASTKLHLLYPDAPLSKGFYHGRAGAEWIPRKRNTEGSVL